MILYIIFSLITYIISIFIAPYLMVGRYKWFSELELKLNWKYPTKQIYISKIFNFKLFHCDPCCLFWFNFVINLFLYFIIYAFIISIIGYAFYKYIILKEN